MNTTRIIGASVVNEMATVAATVVIHDDVIAHIIPADATTPEQARKMYPDEKIVDGAGCYLLPGVIDDHVHFREPGLTQKADIRSESIAAAAGGVTSYFDMPNVVPQTTTLEALNDKYARAERDSVVNYSFFFGATNDNVNLLEQLDPLHVCGVKLFMGSSTGNMLVDREEALKQIFEKSPLLIMTHCEDTAIIQDNMEKAVMEYGPDPDITHFPEIRSREACIKSTALAVKLARTTHARLHVAHVTSAEELQLFSNQDVENKLITAEACIAHLMFTADDYSRLGARIKCNPSIKYKRDRDALRDALTNGLIDVVATDHAPHLLAEKQGGCRKAVSGMPMVQFSLVSMLELVQQGVLSLERVVKLMCHAPAQVFGVKNRGYIREGYQADMVLVRPSTPWTVTPACILSKCGWSPLEGTTFRWRVEKTFCNGKQVYDYEQGVDVEARAAQAIVFNR